MQVKSITTFTGREVDPLDIRFDDIDIRDIAHALALCNRFAGHTRWPISVAQHSVGVSFLSGSNREHQLQGLLHDAAEAYLGDVTKWLKDSPEMAAYRAAEDAALSTIMYKFGLPSELHSIVNAADRMMVRFEFEMSYLRGQMKDGYGKLSEGERIAMSRDLDPLLWRPVMTWQEAEASFLIRFADLTR